MGNRVVVPVPFLSISTETAAKFKLEVSSNFWGFSGILGHRRGILWTGDISGAYFKAFSQTTKRESGVDVA